MLRGEGQSPEDATAALVGVSVAAKNELLFARGVNFNDLPTWQKRGLGTYWVDVEHEGFNPVSNESTTCTRRELRVDLELPRGDAYGEFGRRAADVGALPVRRAPAAAAQPSRPSHAHIRIRACKSSGLPLPPRPAPPPRRPCRQVSLGRGIPTMHL